MSQQSQQVHPTDQAVGLQQMNQKQAPQLTFLKRVPQQYRRLIWLFVAVTFCSLLTTFYWPDQGYATLPPTPGRIRVVKLTQPVTANVDFTFTLTSTTFLRSFKLGHDERKLTSNLPSEITYQVAETLPPGWGQATADCSDGSPATAVFLNADELVTCTFTNVKLGKLIIKVVTVPSNDTNTPFVYNATGGLNPSSITLTGGQTETLTDVMPGTYVLTGELPAGWKQSSAVCSDGSTLDNLVIAPDETVTCTVTNTQLGKLIVRKVTNPNPDRTNALFSFTASGGLTPATFTLRNGQSRLYANLEPGSGYTIAEQPLANWQVGGATCDDNSPITNIQLSAGETVTCTFLNEATLVNLTLTKSDDDLSAEPGDTIVYRLKYRNTGNKSAEAVVMTEQVPANTTFVGPADLWSCAPGAAAGTLCTSSLGELAGGAPEGSLQFKVKVNSSLPAEVTQIENTAYIGYSGNARAAETSETTPLQTKVGLTLSKDDGGVSAHLGETLVYTLTYNNTGNQALVGVVISETVPANTTFVGPSNQWSCAVGSQAGTICRHTMATLLGKSSGTVPFIVTVAGSLPADVTAITNRAVIGSLLTPNADDGTERTEIAVSPDLAVGISDNDLTAAPGDEIRYRISYSNVGARAAAGVKLTTTLPPHTQFNSGASSTGWQCSGATCTYAVGKLASGGGKAVDLAVTVNRPLPAGTTNLAITTAISDDGKNGSDPTPQNNTATVSTPVSAPIAFTATKQAALVVDTNSDSKAGPGDTLEYTIVLRNQGGLGLRQLTLTDELDPNLQLVSTVTTSQGTVTKGNSAADRQVAVTVGDLAGAGGAVTIRFRVVVDQPLAAGVYAVQNQATVRSPDFADRRTDDPATAAANDATRTSLEAVVALRADLNDFLFVDADNDQAVSVGDTLIYQLALQNVGAVDSGALTISINRNANVTLVPGSVNSSRGVVIGGDDPMDDVVVDVDDIAVGANVKITFQVKLVTDNGGAISHQAAISFQDVGGQKEMSSDDPDTAGANDATVTPIGSAAPSYSFYLPLINR